MIREQKTLQKYYFPKIIGSERVRERERPYFLFQGLMDGNAIYWLQASLELHSQIQKLL
jgi:hypothetical protein